ESKQQEQVDGGFVWTECWRCEFEARQSSHPEGRSKAQDARDARMGNAAVLESQIPPRLRPATLDNYRTVSYTPVHQPT
ncbi:ATP-binding protein, partial [Pseudomonas aeruginosa]